jgi:hypothetical protein
MAALLSGLPMWVGGGDSRLILGRVAELGDRDELPVCHRAVVDPMLEQKATQLLPGQRNMSRASRRQPRRQPNQV